MLAGQAAKAEAEEARALLEKGLSERPDDLFGRSQLAWVYLALGRNADALRLSREAADLLTIEMDAILGAAGQLGLAEIEAWAGEPQEATNRLRHLLSIPSGISIARLKIDPVWIRFGTTRIFRGFSQARSKSALTNSGMGRRNFFSELKRRNVYRVAVAYAIVGWLVVQIATQVFPFLEIPTWVVRLVIAVVAIGFPIALIIAWAFELTPEGIKRTEVADRTPAAAGRKKHIWISCRCDQCCDLGRVILPWSLHSQEYHRFANESIGRQNCRQPLAIVQVCCHSSLHQSQS